MVLVVVHKATVKDYLLFVLGKSFDVKCDILYRAVSLYYLCGELFLALKYCLADTAYEYVITRFVGEVSALGKCKGKNTQLMQLER